MRKNKTGEKLILGKKTMIDTQENLDGGNYHVCVIGGSGRGKSHSIVKPNILSWGVNSSMIISDPKGALEKEFTGYLKKMGYRIYSIDLIHPEKSAYGYNPLKYISSENDFIKLAHRLTYLDPMTRNCIKQDPYWSQMAEVLISSIVALVCITEKEEEMTLDKVMDYISNLINHEDDYMERIMEHIQEQKKDSFAVRQWKKIRNIMAAEKTWTCVVSSAGALLDIYESKEIREWLSKKPTFDFDKLAMEKSVVFLKVSDNDDTYYNLAN